MEKFFTKTISELTALEPLEIRGLGDMPLTAGQLSTLFYVVNYRFENLLPTTTHTDRRPFELCKAVSGGNGPDFETLAYAIVGRLWEMDVVHSKEPLVEAHDEN